LSVPTEWGSALTHILVVQDLARATAFYRDVIGAEVEREYGGTSCVLRLMDAWLLLVTGGPPTPDKPSITFASPSDPDRVSHSMTFRVADCRGTHDLLASRGAVFLTPPVESAWEIRAFFRDPDGHLLEISEAR
jgi:catechol 2,3-dioxygenase-like lactoylglutathione lyase family enzyme